MKIPSYLSDIEIKKFRAPATKIENDLPFEMLEPRIFEIFCCELVHKKMELELQNKVVEVLPIGVSGQKQFGADIFVKEISDSHDRFTLYEVKRVKSYSLKYYIDTVTRFIENIDKWGFEVSEFNLFVADNISAEEIALWQSEASKLSSKSISYKVIPSSTLNKWVRNFPELVYKYFHPAWTELLFGKSAIWHLENYGSFGFDESASWIDYQGVVKEIYGDSLSYKNDHVKIQAFLPSLERNNTSCYVEFRNGKFSHLMITLNHRQLVKDYFSGATIPLLEGGRPYLLQMVDKDGYFCDIGNCRIKLSDNEAESLCNAFDVYWEEYRKRINNIEESWGSKFFNHGSSSNEDVPLLLIKRNLWSLLLDFSREHDAFNSAGEWSVFDSCPGWLKIYTKNTSKKMDAGYHAFIKPKNHEKSFTNYRKVDDDVVLAWQPPNDYVISQNSTIISPRYYWDAKTTHNWLKYELIPHVLEWGRKISESNKVSKFLRVFSKKVHCAKKYNPNDYVVSFYEPYLNESISTIDDIEKLEFVVNKLQSFFNSSPENIFIDETSYRKLYISLSKVLSNTEYENFSYLHSNLNYLQANDIASLANAVRMHSDNSKGGCANSFRIDCALRCIQVCIGDNRSHLNSYEIKELIQNILPLLDIMEDRLMLNRQSKLFD